jgi:hypothetical protein
VSAFLAALRPSDPDWLQFLLAAIILGGPLLGRILKGAGEAMKKAGSPGPARPSRPRQRRARAEVPDGEDLWRRLLRGEELPVPRPRPEPPGFHLEQAPADEPPEPVERERAAPLSVLESEDPPGEVLTTSIPVSEPALASAHAVTGTPAGAIAPLGGLFDRRGLRHAILVSEVLGPPVSLRRP